MSAGDYLEYIFLEELLSEEFASAAAQQWLEFEELRDLFQQAGRRSVERFGFTPNEVIDEVVSMHFSAIHDSSAVTVEGDELIGIHLFLHTSHFHAYVKDRTEKSAVHRKVSRLGEEILEKAISTIALQQGWDTNGEMPADEYSSVEAEFEGQISVPASDRIVTLQHNQRSDLETATTEVIDGIDAENGIDGDGTERQVLLGRFRAARELIRESVFEAKIMYILVFESLKRLAERYKDHAIGAAASKLLDLLIKHVFGA